MSKVDYAAMFDEMKAERDDCEAQRIVLGGHVEAFKARAEKAEAERDEAQDKLIDAVNAAEGAWGREVALTEALERIRDGFSKMTAILLLDGIACEALANFGQRGKQIMAVVEAAISYRTNLKSGSLIATQQAGDTLDRALGAYEGSE